MNAVSLYQFFKDSFSEKADERTKLWLMLCLLFAAIPVIKALFEAFSAAYVVQDDARVFVFWMRRWLDPELFQGDPIADYFQSVSPPGFKALYWLPAQLGIDPMVTNKLLPMVLNLALAYYAFKLAMALLHLPPAAFLASALTVFMLSATDNVFSATPRAFAVPFFVPFLFYLVRQKPIGVTITTALLALFYPPVALVALGVLGLSPLRWKRGPRLELTRAALMPVVAGTAVGLGMLIPFVLSVAEFGPTITLEQARAWPTFYPGGRIRFFLQDGTVPILCGLHTGFIPREWACSKDPPLLSVVHVLVIIALPVSLFLMSLKPGERRPQPETMLLILVLVAATLLFAIAHLRLFELYMPRPYSQFPLHATTLLALGLVLALWFERGLRWAGPVTDDRLAPRQKLVLGSALSFISILLISMIPRGFVPNSNYQQGSEPELYAFFAAQPKDSLIASLSGQTNYLPTFSRRSVLTAQEYAAPLSLGYILPFRDRTRALITALYHPDVEVLRSFIADYGIDFILMDRRDLTIDRLRSGWWSREYPAETAAALDSIRQGGMPAIADFVGDCAVFKNERFLVLSGECMAIAGAMRRRSRHHESLPQGTAITFMP